MTAEFLTSGPLSLTEIISAIRVQSMDAESKPVFNDDEIKLALRKAILNSHGTFFTTDITELDITSGNFGPYDLDDDVDRIILVTRDRGSLSSPSALNTETPGVPFNSWRHVKRPGANELYLLKDNFDTTLTILYERDVQVPIDNRTLSATLSSGATTMSLVDADPQLWRVKFPAYFMVDHEIVKATAASSNTSVTIARAQLGTTAASHAEGAEISMLVLADTDRFYNFLFEETGRLLNEMRVQSGNAGVSVAANITSAKFFKDNAKDIEEKRPQPRRTRRMHFNRGSRRPRRDI